MSLMKYLTPSFLVLLSLFSSHWILGSDVMVGFKRITDAATAETLSWNVPNRFSEISLEANIPFYGSVREAAGDEIVVSGAFWEVDEFASGSAGQGERFVVEIMTGSSAGSRFAVTENTGSSLKIDLDGGTLAGVGPGIEVQVLELWTLDSLFPEGRGLMASSGSIRGSELVILENPSQSPEFVGAGTYQYRSDLGRWINVMDSSVDEGGKILPFGSGLVIRQPVDAPIAPIFAGHQSTGVPLHVAVSYLAEGPDQFSDALLISGQGFLGTQTFGATSESGEPIHENNSPAASVWFEYVPSQSGTLTLRTEYSDFDTILAAYSGSSIDDLQLLGSNDDAPGQTWSELSVAVSSGVSVYIAIDGKNGADGVAYLERTLSSGIPEISVEQPDGMLLTDALNSYDFGEVRDDDETSAVTFTIRNLGSAMLSNLSASISGEDSSDFVTSGPATTTLEPSEATTVSVQFSPTGSGVRSASLQIGSNDADENPFDITLTGVSVPRATLSSWASGFGLSGNSLLPGADDDEDQITLLEEYAYNLDPTQADREVLIPGVGTKGLPSVQLVEGRLRVEFLRRLNDSDLSIVAHFSEGLTGGFEESSEEEIVLPIDDEFERVIILDDETIETSSRRFSRVELTRSQP